MAYQGLVWQCRYSDIEVPDALWRCTVFGAGKPFADDQVDNMMREADALQTFDQWVRDFAGHVAQKGVVATKADERAAATTTNQDKKTI